jgi:hypothetical protein
MTLGTRVIRCERLSQAESNLIVALDDIGHTIFFRDDGGRTLSKVIAHVNSPSGNSVPIFLSLDSSQWSNVLVHVEEIVRIVFRLEFLESAVVWAIRGSDRLARLVVPEIIYVSPRCEEPLHLAVRLFRPGDALVVGRGLHPLRKSEEIVTLGAGRERGVGRRDARRSPVEMFQE